MLKIAFIGGFDEVGKNCVAINSNGTVVIVDMGLDISKYIEITEDNIPSKNELINYGAVPNIEEYEKLNWPKPKLIFIAHGHLDHVGAIPHIITHFKNVKIMGTAFTIKILEKIYLSERKVIENPIEIINSDCKYYVDENITLVTQPIAHSILDTTIVCIKTPDGNVVYANDFKIDTKPVLGKPTDLKKIKKAFGDIKFLITDSTGSVDDGKSMSEEMVKKMLDDLFSYIDVKENLIVVTTFSSHIQRLSTIVKKLKKEHRKVFLIGRSLEKYTSIAKELGYFNFDKYCERVLYPRQIQKFFNKIKNNKIDRRKIALIITGHQGEPNAILAKILSDRLPDFFQKDDVFIFSSRIIPVPMHIENRAIIDQQLKDRKVRIFKDIHVSGHPAKEDLREFINMMNPEFIVPSHCDKRLKDSAVEVYQNMGYKLNENIIYVNNSNYLEYELKNNNEKETFKLNKIK